MGVLHALKAHGFRVPEDMAVVGFDDLEARTATPPLTTARQPIYEMGMRAARLVLSQMRGERVLDENMFEPRVIVRASCGARGVPRMPPVDPAARPVFLGGVDRHDHWLWSLAHREASAKATSSAGLGPLLDLMQIDFNRERDAAVVLRELVIAGRQEALRAIRSLAEHSKAEELLRGLAWFLPQLHVDTCFVSRLAKPNDAEGNARLFAAFQRGEVKVNPAAPAYPARRLLPQDVALPPEDRLWLVHPLLRDGSMLGFAVLCGRLYDPAAVAELCHILAIAL
jgi:hypothetical protein